MRPPRERDTQDLIHSLRSKRRRRRTGRIVAAVLVLMVVLAGIITGGVLAGRSPGEHASSTSSSLVETTAKSTTTSTDSSETTERATTTGSPTTLAAVTTVKPASSPTTEGSTSSTNTTTSDGRLAGKVITIDPGHQAHANSSLEPVGPGSSEKKAKVSSGTASPTTGTPESEITLAVGLELRDALKALGAKVVMTRTTENVDVPNSKRAQIGNQAHSDLTIRLHCDGSTDRSVHGLSTLYPASIKGWTDDIAAASKKAAAIIHRNVIATTGAKDRGLRPRSDLTGFNWSGVPSVLVEMGYMTNAAEDRLLESGAYQDKIVKGLVAGIVEFVRVDQ